MNGEGGVVCESNGRATVLNLQFKATSGAHLEDPEEPFHGFEESGSSGDSTGRGIRRSTRDRKKPDRLIEDPNFFTYDDNQQFAGPQTYAEAISSLQSIMRFASMLEEIQSLNLNKT